MKTTGYAIREALRVWELKRDALSEEFQSSIYAFPGEAKDVRDIARRLVLAEEAIAKLQTAQAQYNAAQTVSAPALERTISLTEAIKRIGGMEREERLWKYAATKASASRNSYGVDDSVRKSDEERKQRVLSVEDSVTEWARTTKLTSSMRSVIAIANANPIEIEGLDPALLSP